ncbi:MAG: tetratricopeptide repeat protein [Lysobacter sp.]
MKPGDYLIHRDEDGDWQTVYLLEVDRWPDGSEVFHCLSYAPVRERPSADALDALQVRIYHAPIDSAEFRAHWSVLHSRPVTDRDRLGFFEYLKHTDFPRYIEASGQDLSEVIARANAAYREGCALNEQAQPRQAIEHYTRAFELFPLFFEAIDNRAFSLMDLGEHVAALAGFEDSLRVNPQGEAALFSRGECLLKLGRYDEAEAAFREGAQRPGDNQALYRRFEQTARDQRELAARGE